MRLSVKTNVDEVFDKLEAAIAKSVPDAIAVAMNRAVRAVADAEREEMHRVFDRPTPWTLNSFDIEGAHTKKLEASVFIRSQESRTGTATAEYLVPQLEGGVRQEKRVENVLRSFGYLPGGMFVVPGAGARLDRYGNISRGQIQQILSGLRASESVSGHTSDRPRPGTSSAGSSAARKARARRRIGDFFVAHRDRPHGRHLHPGVYRRDVVTKKIIPVLIFVRQPAYSRRLEFDRIADETSARLFPGFLREELLRRGVAP